MENLVCQCTKEKAIEKLEQELIRLRDFQYTDHDLLVRLDSKMDNMNTVLETLVKKVDALSSQPADRFEKLKMVVVTTGITATVMYFFNLLIQRM